MYCKNIHQKLYSINGFFHIPLTIYKIYIGINMLYMYNFDSLHVWTSSSKKKIPYERNISRAFRFQHQLYAVANIIWNSNWTNDLIVFRKRISSLKSKESEKTQSWNIKSITDKWNENKHSLTYAKKYFKSESIGNALKRLPPLTTWKLSSFDFHFRPIILFSVPFQTNVAHSLNDVILTWTRSYYL